MAYYNRGVAHRHKGDHDKAVAEQINEIPVAEAD
jgi:hypothetical protein